MTSEVIVGLITTVFGWVTGNRSGKRKAKAEADSIEVKTAKESLEIMLSINKELQKEILEMRKEMIDLKKELSQVRKENHGLSKELHEVREENSKLRKEMANLKKSIEEQNNKTSNI